MREASMGHPRKLRLAGIAAVAIALAGVAPAVASAASYRGTFPDGGTVSFKAVSRDGVLGLGETGCGTGDLTWSAARR